jgi:RNA polymerase sigma factor (TIGR02999 family)
MRMATDVTLLLSRWCEGDSDAFAKLSEAVYPDLRRIAASYLQRERPDHTLQPTALIHEAFLRLVDAGNLQFQSRKQFFALSAQLMRRILVDHARTLAAAKRGAGARKVPIDAIRDSQPAPVEDFLAVHEALEELEKLNARKARAIELRYFAGLKLEEIGEVLGISTSAAHNDLRFAEAWLADRLSGGGSGSK